LHALLGKPEGDLRMRLEAKVSILTAARVARDQDRAVVRDPTAYDEPISRTRALVDRRQRADPWARIAVFALKRLAKLAHPLHML